MRRNRGSACLCTGPGVARFICVSRIADRGSGHPGRRDTCRRRARRRTSGGACRLRPARPGPRVRDRRRAAATARRTRGATTCRPPTRRWHRSPSRSGNVTSGSSRSSSWSPTWGTREPARRQPLTSPYVGARRRGPCRRPLRPVQQPGTAAAAVGASTAPAGDAARRPRSVQVSRETPRTRRDHVVGGDGLVTGVRPPGGAGLGRPTRTRPVLPARPGREPHVAGRRAAAETCGGDPDAPRLAPGRGKNRDRGAAGAAETPMTEPRRSPQGDTAQGPAAGPDGRLRCPWGLSAPITLPTTTPNGAARSTVTRRSSNGSASRLSSRGCRG